MLKMMEAVESLIAIGAEPTAMYRDNEIRDRSIVAGYTLKQVVEALRQQLKRDEETQLQRQMDAHGQVDLPPRALRFSQFLNYLTQSPLASEQFGDLELSCLYDTLDVSYEAAGYAAHFQKAVFEGTCSATAMVSMEGCAPFDKEWLAVIYMYGKNGENSREVWNIFSSAHVRAVARTFEHNPKHDAAQTLPDGTQVAAMDLRGMAAQRVLNRAVKLPLANETRLFARHNGTIYVFPCHLTAQRVYHGYPVEPAEMRRRMSDVCSALYRYFKWPELKV